MDEKAWRTRMQHLHFDIMAYNMRSRAGRPKGGEAMGLRAVCEYLERKYRTA